MANYENRKISKKCTLIEPCLKLSTISDLISDPKIPKIPNFSPANPGKSSKILKTDFLLHIDICNIELGHVMYVHVNTEFEFCARIYT